MLKEGKTEHGGRWQERKRERPNEQGDTRTSSDKNTAEASEVHVNILVTVHIIACRKYTFLEQSSEIWEHRGKPVFPDKSAQGARVVARCILYICV